MATRPVYVHLGHDLDVCVCVLWFAFKVVGGGAIAGANAPDLVGWPAPILCSRLYLSSSRPQVSCKNAEVEGGFYFLAAVTAPASFGDIPT